MSFNEWVNSVDGQTIDIDGNWGGQCWDLWCHYAMNVFGTSMWAASTNSGGEYHHYGYTCEIWHNFSGSPLGQWFTPHNGTPQRGDVVIWEWGSAVGPNSHIAVVLEDAGDSVLCLTQNPGATRKSYLSKAGVLGYLRPDNQSVFDSPVATVTVPSGSINELAQAVLRGEYGNGPDRVTALGSQYEAVQARVNEILNGEPTVASTGVTEPSGQTYTIVSGDTLWGIAERFYGDGSRYMEIYNASSLSSGNPSLIYPGETVIIP